MSTLLGQTSPLTVSESPLVAFLSLATGDILYVTAAEARWSNDKVSLSVSAEDPEDEGLLDNMGNQGFSYVVGYRRNVALCEMTQNAHIFRQQKRTWSLEFDIRRTDFIPSMEVGFSSTSADKLAELRTRRLLLNENPATESRDINEITRELFLGGQQTVVRIERSIFPALFSQFGAHPARFVRIAWISAVLHLKLGGCVAEIGQLVLTVRGRALDVKFVGKRNKRFVNAPPYEISIVGTCAL